MEVKSQTRDKSPGYFRDQKLRSKRKNYDFLEDDLDAEHEEEEDEVEQTKKTPIKTRQAATFRIDDEDELVVKYDKKKNEEKPPTVYKRNASYVDFGISPHMSPIKKTKATLRRRDIRKSIYDDTKDLLVEVPARVPPKIETYF